eukprot:5177865-Amphidinium_carterae.1
MQPRALSHIYGKLEAAGKFSGPASNFQDDLPRGKVVIDPSLEVDDVQALARPHLDERMHPPAQVGLRALSGPEHGGAEPREDGKAPLTPSQGFVLPCRAKHPIIALLSGLESGTSQRPFQQPSLLDKDYVVQFERQTVHGWGPTTSIDCEHLYGTTGRVVPPTRPIQGGGPGVFSFPNAHPELSTIGAVREHPASPGCPA